MQIDRLICTSQGRHDFHFIICRKALHLLVSWVEAGGDAKASESRSFQAHVQRVPAYLWVAEETSVSSVLAASLPTAIPEFFLDTPKPLYTSSSH